MRRESDANRIQVIPTRNVLFYLTAIYISKLRKRGRGEREWK